MSITQISQPTSPVRPQDTGGAEATRSGTVGERGVTTGAGGQPRAAESRSFLQKVADLFSRSVTSGSGAERRAAPPCFSDMPAERQQAVTQAMNKHLGKAMEALRTPGSDTARATEGAKALQAFAKAAASLAGDPHGTESLDGTLAKLVEALPADQRQAVLEGIRSDRGGALQAKLGETPLAEKALMMLEQRLTSALLADTHATGTAAAGEKLATGLSNAAQAASPAAAGDAARGAFGAARAEVAQTFDAMVKLGMRPSDRAARDAFISAELFKLAAGSGDGDHALSPHLLRHLEAPILRQLGDAASAAGNTAASEEISSESIRRLSEKVDGIPLQLSALTSTYPADAPANASALTAAVGSLAEAIVAGGKLADKLGLASDLAPTAGRALAQHMDSLAANGHLTLTGLSDAEVHRLEVALRTLGSDTAAVQVTGEADSRRATARAGYHQAFDAVLTAVQSGDAGQILQTVRASGAARDTAAAALEQLGLSLDGADDMMAAREMLMATRLSTLPLDDLIGLYGTLNHFEARSLAAGLSELSYEFIQSDTPLFRAMFDVGCDLMLLRQTLEQALTDQGVSLPPRPDAHIPDGVAYMNRDGFAAIKSTFGVEANDGAVRVVSGTVSGAAATAFEAAVTVAASPSQHAQATIGGTAAGVSDIFLRDLNRMTFTGPTGTALFDLAAWTAAERLEDTQQAAAQHDQVQRDSIDTLRQVLGNDDALTFAVSQFANQASLAPVSMLLMGPDTPLMLQTGVTGSIVPEPGGQHTAFQVARTPTGEATIDVRFSTSGNRFMGADGAMQWLDRDHQTSTFTFQLTVDRTGAARLTQPLRFDNDLRANTGWPAGTPYPEPRREDLPDILSGRDPILRSDFVSVAQAEYSMENVEFYDAIERYRAAPSEEAAEDMLSTFVTGLQGANLSSGIAGGIRQALTLNPADPTAFDAARREVLANMFDTLARFTDTMKERYA